MVKDFFTERKLELGKIIECLQHQNGSLKKFNLEIKLLNAKNRVGKYLLIVMDIKTSQWDVECHGQICPRLTGEVL